MLKNFAYFVKVILMLAIVLVNGIASGFMFYAEHNHSCECGPHWKRWVIKFGGIVIGGLAIVAYFTPIVKFLRMIPLLGGLFLLGVLGAVVLMLYCIQTYLKSVHDNTDCDCNERGRLEHAHKIIGWASTTVLLITACVTVFIMFYLF